MRFDIWLEDDGNEVTLVREHQKIDLSPDAVHYVSFDADTIKAAMKKHYEIMGWGEYKEF